jgi:5-methylcytosine-specific restriction endonuclease McrA
MNPLQKTRATRLSAPEYSELCEQVLKRDSWRCQFCGSMKNLEVHHQCFRSHSGEDIADNLITACHRCHSSLHLGELQIDEPF